MTHSLSFSRSVLAAGIACTLLAVGSAVAQQTTASATGVYTILIRGSFYTGDGTATVSGGFVSIQATVRDDSGRTGTLEATQLSMVGDHFRGSATLLGVPITVQGRVDAADPITGNPMTDADAILTDARIGAMFSDPRGHTGRIAGTKQKPVTTTPAK